MDLVPLLESLLTVLNTTEWLQNARGEWRIKISNGQQVESEISLTTKKRAHLAEKGIFSFVLLGPATPSDPLQFPCCQTNEVSPCGVSLSCIQDYTDREWSPDYIANISRFGEGKIKHSKYGKGEVRHGVQSQMVLWKLKDFTSLHQFVQGSNILVLRPK